MVAILIFCNKKINIKNEEFTWERFHDFSVLITDNEFINIQPREIKGLKLVLINNYPENWKKETVAKTENLKKELNRFWIENKIIIC